MSKSLQRVEALQGRLTDAYRRVDQLILSVATGVIAISVTFSNGFAKIVAKNVLAGSWILLLLAIFGVLISLLFEIQDKQYRIHRILKSKSEKASKFDVSLKVLNCLNILFFGIGIAGIVIVLLANLFREV